MTLRKRSSISCSIVGSIGLLAAQMKYGPRIIRPDSSVAMSKRVSPEKALALYSCGNGSFRGGIAGGAN
jgi:hypothetical protein